MAFGILQLSLVFTTIGLYVGLASDFAEAVGINEIPLSLTLKNPQDVVLAREQNVILKCEAESSAPGLSISWSYQDKPLLANDTRVQLLSDGSLNISKAAARKMEGSYRCLAKNDFGAVLSNSALLKVAAIDREFIEQPENINTTEQQPILFPCRIHSIPDASIGWERDNKTLPQNERYVPLPSGALLITNTHSTDTGIYRCIAKHRLLKKTKRSRSGQLLVSPSPEMDAPPRILPLNLALNITSLVGSKVTLYCIVTGWPLPTLTWIYNSDQIISNKSILYLDNITEYVSGNYSCIARNKFGEVSMDYTLQVFAAPYFNVTPISISYPSARMVRLDCKAEGVPRPKISWLKNGAPIELIGRIKQQNTSLVLSHSFITDAGIYQCVASNTVGEIWSSARLLPLFSNNRPKPPQNVTCQPYDDNSICITWTSPLNITIQAYSIYLFNSVRGYDFVTNYTYLLVNGLERNSDYAMYVRSYSNEASDQSNNVSCSTGMQGHRNLQAEFLSETSVQLTWSELSNDFPCGTKKHLYKVQWKKFGQPFTYVLHTADFRKVISRLQPSTVYEFRVQSTTNKNDESPWVTYSPLREANSSEIAVTSTDSHEIFGTENQTVLSLAPVQIEVEPLTPYSVNLTWSNFDGDNLTYTVYCTDVKEKTNRVLESKTNFLEVADLKPDTLYAFKVRSQNSPFSQSIELQTSIDVPSPVKNLRARVVNSTTVCVTWKSSRMLNGKFLTYVVSYTSNQNLPLEKWHNLYIKEEDVSINQCWSLNQDEISIILRNLSADVQYTLVVRAVSDTGSGNPAAPITFSTHPKMTLPNSENESPDDEDEVDNKQKLGVAVGVTISALCVLCFVSCVIFRRRCMKREAIRRARLTNANNYYTSELPYSAAPLHIHQDSCITEAHEMQQLVLNDDSTHIPPIETTHLDTKGGIGFPNGQMNGSLKHMHMNGHVANGHIHITENPRYDYHSCNGNQPKKIKKDCLLPQFSHLEDDKHEFQIIHPTKPTSNHSLPIIAENSKTSLKVFDVSDYNSNCNSDFIPMYALDSDLNDTQITYLDESFSSLPNRIALPTLAPNG